VDGSFTKGDHMLNENDARQIVGSTAYGSDGEKIGKVGHLFLNDETGHPEFVTVNTGLFGTSESFAPVQDATLEGGELRLGHTKEVVKDAPRVELDDGHMAEADEQRLLDYYRGSYGSESRTDSPTDSPTDAGSARSSETGRAVVGQDVSGPETDEAMTRSEEHLRVGTATQEAGRVRLRKYVTTETETRTVPVRKEHAVLETEPITDANRDEALDGPAISEEEHEVVLHEERPVVETVAEPVERVRMGTETTVEDETVSGEVRKEEIEAEGAVDRRS
jgi:uncharacterized protein (TIGR02271 family)